MRTDVVTIRADDSARSLARLLADSEISGVPVLDGNGAVVGVASTTDLVRLAAGEAEISLASATLRPEFDRSSDIDEEEFDDVLEADPYGFFLPEDSAFAAGAIFEQLPESTFDRMTVEDVMTPVSFSVRPDMTVPELCAYLVRGRIHRALVVESGALVGIVTSQDVLRAVAEGSLVV
ncbi:MAG: CBS domain-containing protein [Gemmatimonadota bacterium]|nr:CBS domain-containing protein [Gemmatimonadota bacterium]